MPRFPRLLLSIAPLALSMLAGCGVQPVGMHVGASAAAASGEVKGGQQPVAGAFIQLYGVGTAGDGTGATPLFTNGPVKTTPSGNFNFGTFSCTGVSQVYLAATQGDPGGVGNNPNIAAMAALGPCSGINSSTYVSVNELTTVAAVSALAPYMNPNAASPVTTVASGTGDASALAQAFTLASEYADSSRGRTPGVGVPAGMTVPTTLINTLGDILAACINTSGGSASDTTTPCGKLFSLTTVNTAPTDTVGAMLNIVNHPTMNTSQLLSLVTASSPFQPVLTSAPASYSVGFGNSAIQFTATSLAFNSLPVGSTQVLQLGMYNAGASTLSIDGISLGGPNSNQFTQTNNCTSSLAPAYACQVMITFAPTVATSSNAVLNVGAGGNATQISLTGSSVAASTGPASLSPTSLTLYGAVGGGYASGATSYNGVRVVNQPQLVTLSNFGNAPLSISSIAVSPTTILSQYNNCGNVLAAQSTCSIYVSAGNRTAYGNGTGSLTVVDSDTGDTQTIPITYNVAQTSIDFGVTAVGQTSTSYYFIPYQGTVQPIKGPPNPNDFYVSGAYAGYNEETRFTPTSTGRKQMIVTVGSGATYLMQGTGGQNGKSFEFGTTFASDFLTTLGQTQTISYQVFSNSNDTDQTFTAAPVVGGPNAGDFSASLYGATTGSVQGCYSGLPKGSSCFISVSFKPQSLGLKFATITLTESSGASHTLTIQGNAYTYTNPYLNPSSLAFGSLDPGTTSPAKTVTAYVFNSDAMTARISSGSSSPYKVTPAFCAEGAYPCNFSVTFTPSAAGATTDTLIVTDSLSGYTSTVALSGTGNSPPPQVVVSLSPTSLSFASRSVGTTSLAQNVTLTNNGTATLTLSGISLSGTNPADYTQTNNCGSTVAAGASCTISVSFTPTHTGASSANLVFTSNATSSPDKVTLSGTGQ